MNTLRIGVRLEGLFSDVNVAPGTILADESVAGVLPGYLRARGYEVVNVPQGASDGSIANVARTANAAVVTRDQHFLHHWARGPFRCVLLWNGGGWTYSDVLYALQDLGVADLVAIRRRVKRVFHPGDVVYRGNAWA